MALFTLTFDFAVNVSVQPGDILYKARALDQQAGRNHPGTASQYGNSKPVPFGVVIFVDYVLQKVYYDDTGFTAGNPNIGTDYLFFSKDNRANTSGIIGYYAKTKFINDATLPAEIFATAVDYAESSK